MTIAGGTIVNFEAGIRVLESTDVTVKWNTLAENTEGVDLQAGSVAAAIHENVLRNNRSRGIMVRANARDHRIKENWFSGNRVGILLFGATDATVRGNTVSGSVLAGIRLNVLATGNLVRENTIAENPAGVEFLTTPTGSAAGNAIVSNRIETNTCGIKGPVANNTVAGNIFTANGADSCQ